MSVDHAYNHLDKINDVLNYIIHLPNYKLLKRSDKKKIIKINEVLIKI